MRCGVTNGRDDRQAILRAGGELFARHGFKETSIDDIARAACIDTATVYLHFSSKEELLVEVVKRISKRTLDALAVGVKRARTPAGKLRAFIETGLNAVPAIAAEYGLGEKAMTKLIPLVMSLRQGIVMCLEALDAMAARRRPDAVRAGLEELVAVILSGVSPRSRRARNEEHVVAREPRDGRVPYRGSRRACARGIPEQMDLRNRLRWPDRCRAPARRRRTRPRPRSGAHADQDSKQFPARSAEEAR